MCILFVHTLLKVFSHYDLSVLSMTDGFHQFFWIESGWSLV